MSDKISKWPFHAVFQNTFQAILVTDETYSYAVFIYKCGLMEWDAGATNGYTSNGDLFDNHDPSSRDVACVNSPDSDWSNILYQLSEASPPGKPTMTSTKVTIQIVIVYPIQMLSCSLCLLYIYCMASEHSGSNHLSTALNSFCVQYIGWEIMHNIFISLSIFCGEFTSLLFHYSLLV